ncbi:hypothetical protein [Craterilacuibacter sp. RT1T]|uniref:hypothetical protein n=1 Tax=Craterilacuibacter sp. RT1T TaxID=2942211 RepID=UPI0020BEC1A4|nr:hypothetical protein [Craterilacuibacter sp. RT1T]MCL6262679.1 hypothetical protein [Craterilacuibacter sp. RT1T]
MHKRRGCAAAILALVWASGGASADDLFQGTLMPVGAQWQLERCNAVKTRYRLVLPAGADARLEQAWRLRSGHPVQLTLLGEAVAEEGAYRLEVREVRALLSGSCHLESLF